MRVAVIGAGVSGLVAAYTLAKAGVHVVLYEKEDYLGGHAWTVHVNGVDVDLGFMVFNGVTYPNMLQLFESLGVDLQRSEMSFSVSLDGGRGCEWGSRNGLSSLFAQKRNAFSPSFYRMLGEILTFKNDVMSYVEEHENNPDLVRNETLGQFIKSRGYSNAFRDHYLIPMCASIWSCSSEGMLSCSAYCVLSFCRNHHLLQVFGRPQWLTVKDRSHSYVNKIRAELEKRGCQIRTGCAVKSVSTSSRGCSVVTETAMSDTYDGCIMAVHAPDALKILGDGATFDEARVLGAFQYAYSDIYLHHDHSLMPKNPAAWSAWNFLGAKGDRICVTYWLNVLQSLETSLHFFVTLNPPHLPDNIVLKWSTSHPLPTVASVKASLELSKIQGERGIWFCGAYQGYGFHEDGLKGGMVAAQDLLGSRCVLLDNRKCMTPSLMESGARLIVTRFLKSYITTGYFSFLEEGGTLFEFEGTNDKDDLKSVMKIHSPSFYWKVATEADLGLADAYINGDISFVDKEEGLLNLFLILIDGRDKHNHYANCMNKGGWWKPIMLTAGLASAKFFFQHLSRQNTITQARRNISRHYDLSNDLFSLFLDDTMTYSCAIFKEENEDLRLAQMRKVSLLIEKARITNKHEVLEIGCGWGTLALEVVRQTGCRYTGITLSEEQLKYAQQRVKEACLEDKIKFLLCDYRQLPKLQKYDRIISCEMLEAVGHEYMEEFFACCDSVLAEDGIFVLQFISIPDQRYNEYRRSSDFIKEYIFPGGLLPSLNRVTSAMTTASRLCIEHVENIGIHYYQTLLQWRRNFMANKSKILILGFDEKFIRTWDYYFVYCAAGFRSRTLGNYQIVLSRPGNLSAFNNPYEGIPSALAT
ncbi:uncharacterized protein LOC116265647 isoform X4 [Nymphaea colorata]|uniref:uncharacterized protein LOC116265647 isoform X4 n=1 Tax=Nymphaea colorata TaxID=210225 RepID=UPI00214EBACE|nr:uncharacterized protein LOC116265647 isoform X4 [Nymphaea colorata]